MSRIGKTYEGRGASWHVLAAAMACALFGGCSSRVSPRPEKAAEVRYEGSDVAGRWFLISCPDARSNCPGTARLLCPRGYVVVNGFGDAIPAASFGLPHETQTAELRVRCMPEFLHDSL